MADAVVVDASAAVRALTAPSSAAEVFRRVGTGSSAGHAPDLIVAEVANAVLVAFRAERHSLEDAQSLLATFGRSQIRLHSSSLLAPAAVDLAAATGLSAYDAFYAALAAALDVPLVTADRRLADVVPGSVLVS